ncbi:uncharacterized protein LOC125490060 [Plutella xylostella]|uniref:uncharacterized protein LOC125490060 n=1 Tax=Plutella xylostella TaxID=51655 RepID=UPI002032D51E|nr:uncharacterized protein LOC125490060 [Plutella xylostella]
MTVQPVQDQVSTPSSVLKKLNESELSDIPTSMVNLDTQAFIEYFDKKFFSLREEWKQHMNSILQPLQNDMQNMSQRLEKWETRLELLERKVDGLNDLQTEDEKLKKDLIQMERNFEVLDQSSRQFNIEIQNIPENKGEDLIGMTRNIGSLVGVDVPLDSIRSAHRVAPAVQRGGGGGGGARPRNVVVQLATRRLRDALLAAARARRDLSTEQLALPTPARRFFVNEHLTFRNKVLYSKARAEQKSKDYKHVWVKNNVVQMRKTDTSKIIKIRCENDLINLV